jgi:transketolase
MPDTSAPRAGQATATDRDLCNAIRALAMDAVQKANSGHPGMPMGMAEIALALWRGHYRHNPTHPHWVDRDRFVLSNGHGSMLQYALLHLSGYELPIEELINFRQFHSKTPGHPEVGITPGVETTTGPLGQGLANAVGMALAEKLLAAQFNRPGFDIVDHRTYVFLGDGCLMEGISHEVASLAGVWKLGKLVALYDDNGISIDGEVKHWFADDSAQRFRAYGWNVIGPVDGHDVDAVDRAIGQSKSSDKPTLIICRTVIGQGSPNRAGSEKAHGEALGDAEIALTRQAIGWPHPPFEVPAEVYAGWDARPRGTVLERDWNGLFARYAAQFPAEAAEFERRMRGDLPARFADVVADTVKAAFAKKETVATRKASQLALDVLAEAVPEMIGGSADLTGSNLTKWSKASNLRSTNTASSTAGQSAPQFTAGRHINYGVREFGMSAIANGMALHGGLIPFVGTFLTFSDYSRNALRMAALMKQRVIFVFTHDSIGLGEDGPTHQSVEHVASLRLIPHMDVWRPCDTVESIVAWAAAIERKDGPASLMFSRQAVAFLRNDADVGAVRKGGYVFSEAAGGIRNDAVDHRVRSAGCRLQVGRVCPTDCRGLRWKRGTISVTDGWWKYVRAEGAVLGVDTFGESAPAGVVYKHFGLTAENLAAVVMRVAKGKRS